MDKTYIWAADVGSAQLPERLSPLRKRALEIADLFANDTSVWHRIFAPSLIETVPVPQLKGIFASYYEKLGACTQLRQLESNEASAFSGRFELIFERNHAAGLFLTVDPDDPHLILSLNIGNPVPLAGSLSEVLDQLRALSGRVSFQILRLGESEGEALAELNPDDVLAIGSTSKLYLLGELIRAIHVGERAWEEVVVLDPQAVSLPSGILQEWPTGTPITLYALAALMISESDNTAADNLLRVLGRNSVESMLERMGHRNPACTFPFLSTREFFQLKWASRPEHAEVYASKDIPGRRRYLEEGMHDAKSFGFAAPAKPLYIDVIEWFASAADLCRAMNWIRVNTEARPAALARDLLGINCGLPERNRAWAYVGYKGGAEPGVLNLTFLLRCPADAWYALSATWNDYTNPLNDAKFHALVLRAVQLTAESGQP